MNIYLLLAAVVAGVIVISKVVKHLKGRRGRAMAEVAVMASVELEEYGPELKLLEGTGLPFFIDGFFTFLLKRYSTKKSKQKY